jgi:hypothetical protein
MTKYIDGASSGPQATQRPLRLRSLRHDAPDARASAPARTAASRAAPGSS